MTEQPQPSILDRFGLDGRVVLVTGGTGAIGKTIARAAASAHADVAIVARRREPLDAAARELSEQTGRRVEAIVGDIGRTESVDQIVETALATFGKVDVLVNNTFSNPTPADAIGNTDAWDEPWRVNVLGPLRLVHGLTPSMREHGGSVVNILSTAAFVPVAEQQLMPYGVTKAALAMATRYLALQLSPEIRVNAVCPGTTSVDGTFEGAGKPPRVTEIWERLVTTVPLRRLGSAEQTAAAVVYLASDAASYTTGDTIFVDGGRVSVGVG